MVPLLMAANNFRPVRPFVIIPALVDQLDRVVEEHYTHPRPLCLVHGRPVRPFIRRLWNNFLPSILAGDSAEVDIDNIYQLFKWFRTAFASRMQRINNDDSLSDASRAAARRAFYDEAMHTILGPLQDLATRSRPDITPGQETSRITLGFFWSMFIRMREFELIIYLRSGGKRQRRATI